MLTAFSSNWLIFFPLAFSLFVAVRLAEGSADLGRRSTGMVMTRSLIGLMFAFSLLSIGLRANLLGLTWLFLLAGFGFIITLKNRRLERSALLLTAMSTEKPTLQFTVAEAFWTENRGWLHRKSAALRRSLSTGITWWSALEQQGISRSVYETLSVRLAANYPLSAVSGDDPQGNVARSSTEVVTPLQVEVEAERLLGRLIVLSWAVFVIPVVAGILVFVLPTFTVIFQEMGAPLPPAMRAARMVADSLTHSGIVTLLYITMFVLFTGALIACLIWMFPWLLRLAPLRWLCHDYYRNLGFMAFSYALKAEPDLIRACQATSRLVVVENIARRYQRAAQLLAGGMSPQRAFVGARLLSLRESQAFELIFDQRDPASHLRQLSAWKMAKMLNRYSNLVQLAVVLFTLFLALVVGGLAVAMFQALATLITSLA